MNITHAQLKEMTDAVKSNTFISVSYRGEVSGITAATRRKGIQVVKYANINGSINTDIEVRKWNHGVHGTAPLENRNFGVHESHNTVGYMNKQYLCLINYKETGVLYKVFHFGVEILSTSDERELSEYVQPSFYRKRDDTYGYRNINYNHIDTLTLKGEMYQIVHN